MFTMLITPEEDGVAREETPAWRRNSANMNTSKKALNARAAKATERKKSRPEQS